MAGRPPAVLITASGLGLVTTLARCFSTRAYAPPANLHSQRPKPQPLDTPDVVGHVVNSFRSAEVVVKDGVSMRVLGEYQRWLLLIAALVVLAWDVANLSRSSILQTNDFVHYWSAGKLLLSGGDPYSPRQLLAVERALRKNGDTLIPFSPPWALTFMAPLALMDPHLSRLLWLCATLTMVGACIEWSWRLYGGGNSGRHLKWFVGIIFAPTLTVLILGQIGPLIVLGITAFLLVERKRRDFVAGMLLMPAAVKPHLLYLFWIALLLWTAKRRRWSVLTGLGVAWLVCSGIAVLLDPGIFRQYFSLWHDQGILDEVYPVLGGVLRLIFGAEKHWLQFLPSAIGLVWFLRYWRAHHDDWDWLSNMPLLLLVSLVTIPYGWFFDLVVLLPVLMQCTVWLLRSRDSVAVQVASAFIASNIVVFAFIALGLRTFWYVWAAPLWLLLYLILRRTVMQAATESSVEV